MIISASKHLVVIHYFYNALSAQEKKSVFFLNEFTSVYFKAINI